MRSKKMALNALSALVLQIVSMVFGLIIPKMVIGAYGSNVNGLTSSITQFLSYITLFEAGIGGVTRAMLYKPLAERNKAQVEGIIKSTDTFFKRLGSQYLIYALLLSVIYPTLISNSFGILYTGSMVLILTASTLAQYYFGISYTILLNADQKNYISVTSQIVTVFLNGLMTILLVRLGFGIHTVKMGSAVIYVIRPLVLRYYVVRRYNFSGDVDSVPLPEEQKRAGVFHNVAWFLRTNSSIAILTVMSNLSSVSVYSVYYLIASSLSKVVTSITNGAEAMFGNIMATEEPEYTNRMFGRFVFLMNMVSGILFSTAVCVIISFVSLYTKKITDANYIIPSLGVFVLVSEFLYCVRRPYHDIITAAGHFRETRGSAVIEVILNIGLAIMLVRKYGVSGVAVASVIALLYRTIYFIIYLSKNIIKFPYIKSLKYFLATLIQGGLSVLIFFQLFQTKVNGYGMWIGYAIIAFVLSSFISFVSGMILFPEDMSFVRRYIIDIGRKIMKRER